VQPVHVAAYIEQLGGTTSPPSVKQNLACIRMLFDWLVVGQIVASNPAHAVRGPRHSVSKGSTPVLSTEEATALLAGMDVSTVVGLRESRADRRHDLHFRPRRRCRCVNRRRLLRTEKTLVVAPA
jgi:integrase/recombinase XerD